MFIKSFVYYLAIISISLSFLGCSNASKNTPENLIEKEYPIKINFGFNIFNIILKENQSISVNEKLLKLLKNKGLIDYTLLDVNSTLHNEKRVIKQAEIILTNNSKKYFLKSKSGEMPIYFIQESFNKIIEIKKKKDEVWIHYSTKFEPAEPFTKDEIKSLFPNFSMYENSGNSAEYKKIGNEWQVQYLLSV